MGENQLRIFVMCALAVTPACGRGGYDVVLREVGPVDSGPDDNPQPGPPVWTELSASASADGVSERARPVRCKHIALAEDGVLYAAWADDSTGLDAIYVRTWNGAVWSELGGSFSGGGIAPVSGPPAGRNITCLGALAFDDAARPNIAWQHNLGGAQAAYMRRWTGTTWAEVAGSSSGFGLSGDALAWWPGLALDSSNRPSVSWSIAGELYLRSYDGVSWVGLGGSDTSPGLGVAGATAEFSILRRAPGDDLIIAWEDSRDGTTQVHLRRWNGAWAALGTSDGPRGLSAAAVSVSIAAFVLTAAGDPVVMWSDEANGEGYVVRWDGARWLDYAALPRPLHRPTLALDVRDRPVIAWAADDTIGRNIHAAYWDGAVWKTLDPETPGGISSATGGADYPSIAVASDGTVYIGWEQAADGNPRRFYLKALQQGL